MRASDRARVLGEARRGEAGGGEDRRSAPRPEVRARPRVFRIQLPRGPGHTDRRDLDRSIASGRPFLERGPRGSRRRRFSRENNSARGTLPRKRPLDARAALVAARADDPPTARTPEPRAGPRRAAGAAGTVARGRARARSDAARVRFPSPRGHPRGSTTREEARARRHVGARRAPRRDGRARVRRDHEVRRATRTRERTRPDPGRAPARATTPTPPRTRPLLEQGDDAARRGAADSRFVESFIHCGDRAHQVDDEALREYPSREDDTFVAAASRGVRRVRALHRPRRPVPTRLRTRRSLPRPPPPRSVVRGPSLSGRRVSELIQSLAAATRVPAADQLLVFGGQRLEPSRTLASRGLPEDAATRVTTVIASSASSSAASSASSSAPSSGASSASEKPRRHVVLYRKSLLKPGAPPPRSRRTSPSRWTDRARASRPPPNATPPKPPKPNATTTVRARPRTVCSATTRWRRRRRRACGRSRARAGQRPSGARRRGDAPRERGEVFGVRGARGEDQDAGVGGGRGEGQRRRALRVHTREAGGV